MSLEYAITSRQKIDRLSEANAVVALRDTTRRAEHRLVDSTSYGTKHKERLVAVGEFATTIAHEVRNPLSTIAMVLDYLNTLGQMEQAQVRLELAASEVQRLERLLDEILAFAKPQQLRRQTLDLNDLIEETLGNLQDLTSGAQREISYAGPQRPAVVEGDRDKLKQVLINLLTNAHQATLPGEEIAVQMITTGIDGVRIEVVNPGTIADNILARITDPFFTTKPQGSGLGLAIVKCIVEAHAGELSIRSDKKRGVVASVSLSTTISA